MKKVILLAVLFGTFLGVKVQAQGMIVYDPTNEAKMGTIISNSVEQLSKLEKTVDYMKKAEEKLSRVNGYLQKVEDVQKIIDLQRKSIKEAIRVRDKVLKMKGSQSARQYTKTLSSALSAIKNSISNVNSILTNGYFSMSDKERIDFIRQERSRVFSNYIKVKAL